MCTAWRQTGLGGASLGDLFCKIPSSQALDTVTRSHELGVTYFDTAPWYGLGLSESRMGLALCGLPRDSYVLSTKVGRYLRPHQDEKTWDSMVSTSRSTFEREQSTSCQLTDPSVSPAACRAQGWAGGLQNGIEFAYTYDDVMRQYEDSVQRLGTGRIDCLVIHDIEEAEGQQPVHARGTREFLAGEKGGYRALEKLRKDGKIKAFGAGINIAVGTPNHTFDTYKEWNVAYFDFLISCAAPGEKKIDFILMAGNYTLLDLSAWESGILQKCLDHGVGVVVGGAYNSGILATGAVKGAKFNYEDASEEIMERTRKLEAVCKEFGVPLAAAALQFPLGHKAVANVIPGNKSVSHQAACLCRRRRAFFNA
jgi:D-threo-aldose 1-dehydrogenase